MKWRQVASGWGDRWRHASEHAKSAETARARVRLLRSIVPVAVVSGVALILKNVGLRRELLLPAFAFGIAGILWAASQSNTYRG